LALEATPSPFWWSILSSPPPAPIPLSTPCVSLFSLSSSSPSPSPAAHLRHLSCSRSYCTMRLRQFMSSTSQHRPDRIAALDVLVLARRGTIACVWVMEGRRAKCTTLGRLQSRRRVAAASARSAAEATPPLQMRARTQTRPAEARPAEARPTPPASALHSGLHALLEGANRFWQKWISGLASSFVAFYQLRQQLTCS